MERAVVLYDRDCGFCRWSLAKLLAWDRRERLRPVALQDPEADRLLAGMSDEQRMGSWHLATPDGTVRSAGAAFEPLLSLLPGGGIPSRLAGRFPTAVERAYRQVAGNRDRLGPRLSEGAKKRADRRIAARQ
jgi:predicted DCC family thiol-disulfide oxidoreductase YuxK